MCSVYVGYRGHTGGKTETLVKVVHHQGFYLESLYLEHILGFQSAFSFAMLRE